MRKRGTRRTSTVAGAASSIGSIAAPSAEGGRRRHLLGQGTGRPARHAKGAARLVSDSTKGRRLRVLWRQSAPGPPFASFSRNEGGDRFVGKAIGPAGSAAETGGGKRRRRAGQRLRDKSHFFGPCGGSCAATLLKAGRKGAVGFCGQGRPSLPKVRPASSAGRGEGVGRGRKVSREISATSPCSGAIDLPILV